MTIESLNAVTCSWSVGMFCVTCQVWNTFICLITMLPFYLLFFRFVLVDFLRKQRLCSRQSRFIMSHTMIGGISRLVIWSFFKLVWAYCFYSRHLTELCHRCTVIFCFLSDFRRQKVTDRSFLCLRIVCWLLLWCFSCFQTFQHQRLPKEPEWCKDVLGYVSGGYCFLLVSTPFQKKQTIWYYVSEIACYKLELNRSIC